ncbi:hypothetical protein ACXR2U_00015 [Jatrophihabitans sp. YIM 134969]
MTPPRPPAISFLDDDGNELPPQGAEEIDSGDDTAAHRAHARRARVEQWLPDGGGAAITSLLFVLVAWIGASPIVQAVTALAPSGMHRVGKLDEASVNFGNGDYYGVTPGLIPVISFGTRALLVALALVLAGRARHRERSALATAAVATASISLALLVLAAVVMEIGLALGHGAGVYGTPF